MTHHGVRGVPRGDRFSSVRLDRARPLRPTVTPVGRSTAPTVTALPYSTEPGVVAMTGPVPPTERERRMRQGAGHGHPAGDRE